MGQGQVGMKRDGTRTLFQYWNRLRGSRSAPRRIDIDPAEIKELLPDTFILERSKKAEPVFRLAGTRICSIYGEELRGHSFISLWQDSDANEARLLVKETLDNGAITLITFDGLSRTLRTNRFELLLLPLDMGQENTRALGTILPITPAFWLGSDPIFENRLEMFRCYGRRDRSSAISRTPPSFGSEQQIGTTGSDNPGRRIRHLVVFQGGRH